MSIYPEELLLLFFFSTKFCPFAIYCVANVTMENGVISECTRGTNIIHRFYLGVVRRAKYISPVNSRRYSQPSRIVSFPFWRYSQRHRRINSHRSSRESASSVRASELYAERKIHCSERSSNLTISHRTQIICVIVSRTVGGVKLMPTRSWPIMEIFSGFLRRLLIQPFILHTATGEKKRREIDLGSRTFLQRGRPSSDCFRRCNECDNMSCEIDEKTTVRNNVRLGGSSNGGKGGCERRELMNLSDDHLISWLMVRRAKLPRSRPYFR